MKFLLNLADMVNKKVPKKQGQRIKNLTKDPSYAFSHRYHGMVELVKYLLITSHKYVCFRHFSSDPIEKAFLDLALLENFKKNQVVPIS